MEDVCAMDLQKDAKVLMGTTTTTYVGVSIIRAENVVSVAVLVLCRRNGDLGMEMMLSSVNVSFCSFFVRTFVLLR